MKVVIFAHPAFLASTSMPLFAAFLREGLSKAGNDVEVWSPSPLFHRLPSPKASKKWLGYIDQFIVFPLQVRRRLRRTSPDTLFVFADQALGPWVPLVADRPHVVHCHDFLALRSALGEVPLNPVSWTGRVYQKWIMSGFRKGRNFISVSRRTQADLGRFLGDNKPCLSVVVHNGLNHPYRRLPRQVSRERLAALDLPPLSTGFILHVGGNQWYKNRSGVLAIYAAYVGRVREPLPLLLLGAAPRADLRAKSMEVPDPGKAHFVVRPPIEILEAAYSAASVLLFPSHAEGFGWPIVEAMASGCRVLTTDDTPMTEVGGDAVAYLPIPPAPDEENQLAWADEGAARLEEVITQSSEERARMEEAGIDRAQKFDPARTMDRYAEIYASVLKAARARCSD